MGRKARFVVVLFLVATASGTIVYDRLTRSAADNVDMNTPVTVYATTTVSPPPDPAIVLTHPGR